MKSHPAAVDVPARWAEVREARRDMPELSDFLKIQPDQSPAVEELVQVAPKKVPPKPAESVVRPLKLQRQNIKGDQKHAVPAEAEAHPAASPGVAEAQAKPLAPEASETLSQGQAAVPQSAPAEQAGEREGESKVSVKRSEAEAWKVFSQQMGPGWQKRFAAQAAKRLEKLKKKDKKKGKEKKEKKKHKKEKAKAKAEKKEKQDKKGDKKEKKSKKEQGEKERGKKRALLDDDDLAQKGGKERKTGRTTKPAGQEQKDEAQAAAAKKAAAKAKTSAKAKAETKPKAKAAKAKAKAVASAPNPRSASGLAASLDK